MKYALAGLALIGSMALAESPRGGYLLHSKILLVEGRVANDGEGQILIRRGSEMWAPVAHIGANTIALAKVHEAGGGLLQIDYLIVNHAVGQEGTRQFSQILKLGQTAEIGSQTHGKNGEELSEVKLSTKVVEKNYDVQ